MAVEERVAGADARWGQYPADEWSDALVASMKLGGIDHLFFVSGTELAFWQESIAKAQAKGTPAPRLITAVHEEVAINAAMGSAMVRNQPAACAAHVDVGLYNYGGGIHTAWHGSYPILITSGVGPRGYVGSMTGGRNHWVQWFQDARDQGGIVRPYVKMDHMLGYQDNPGLTVSRLPQLAMSEPKGPVYLAVPREMAMLPYEDRTARFPTRDELGLARSPWPDPADARTVARWLIDGDAPCIYVGKLGRSPEAMPAIVQLAELLAVPVMEREESDGLVCPAGHYLYGIGPAPKDADALLIIQSLIPYLPPEGPRPSANVARVNPDPVDSRYKFVHSQADLWITAGPRAAAQAIFDAATQILTQADRKRIEERRAALQRKAQERDARLEQMAEQTMRRRPLHPRVIAYELGKLMSNDAILVNDTLSGANGVTAYHHRTQAGTYFKASSSAGGWGPGAAFGAKLAAPDRDVVLATGDGYFMFGSPMQALWSAAHYKAPYLAVIWVNRAYSTGTTGLKATYPEGVTVEMGNYEGGTFDPPPDFAKLAETVNGYGENVREAEQVGPALRRGLEQVHHGSPAVIACWLPTPIEELSLEQYGGAR